MLIAGVLTSLDYSARRMATSDECVIEETVEGGERIIVEAHGKRHCRKVVVVIGERLFWTIVVTSWDDDRRPFWPLYTSQISPHYQELDGMSVAFES